MRVIGLSYSKFQKKISQHFILSRLFGKDIMKYFNSHFGKWPF